MFFSKLFIYRKIKISKFCVIKQICKFIRQARSGLFSFSPTNFDLDVEHCFLKVSVPVRNRLAQDKAAFSPLFIKHALQTSAFGCHALSLHLSRVTA